MKILHITDFYNTIPQEPYKPINDKRQGQREHNWTFIKIDKLDNSRFSHIILKEEIKKLDK